MALLDLPTWPFEPNWDSVVDESLSWKTDILSSPMGAEQRRSLRYYPRRKLSYSGLLVGNERTLMENLLASYGRGDWYVPLWHETMICTNTVGLKTINCTPSPTLKKGMAVFVMGDTPFDYQIAEVQNVTASTFTIVNALDTPVGPGTRFFPMDEGYLVEPPNLSLLTTNTASFAVQFQMIDGADLPEATTRDHGPLVANALAVKNNHHVDDRGGLRPWDCGTMQSHCAMIVGLLRAQAQLADGTREERATAISFKLLAQDMLDAMGPLDDEYRGPILRQPVPENNNVLSLPNAYYAARDDQQVFKIELAREATQTLNRVIIPYDEEEGTIRTVFAVYPGTSELAYDSPFAPAYDIDVPASDTKIPVTQGSWTTYPTNIQVTLPAGTASHTTWKAAVVIETTRGIARGEGVGDYPYTPVLTPGTVYFEGDGLAHFDAAMRAAIAHDNRPGKSDQWTSLRGAVRRSAVLSRIFDDGRAVFDLTPRDTWGPVGNEPYGIHFTSDHPAAKGATGVDTDPNWTGYNFWERTSAGHLNCRVPKVTPRPPTSASDAKFASATYSSETFDGGIATLRINGQPYTYNYRSEKNFVSIHDIAAIINRHNTLVSAESWTTSRLVGDDLYIKYHLKVTARAAGVAGNAITVSVDAGYTAIGPTAWSAATLAGGTNATYVAQSLVPYRTEVGRAFVDQWRNAGTFNAADYYMHAEISMRYKPLSAKNEHLLIYVSTSADGDENQRWYADISGLAAWTDDTIQTLRIERTAFRRRTINANGSTTWGTALPANTLLRDFGVVAEIAESAYRLRVQKLRIVTQADTSATGDVVPFTPSIAPFVTEARLTRKRITDYYGLPFIGHQYPSDWWHLESQAASVHATLTAGSLSVMNSGTLSYPIAATISGVTKPKNALLMEQQIQVLKSAQDGYVNQGGTIGPFGVSFVQAIPQRRIFGAPALNSWIFDGVERNAGWMGYQARVVADLADLCVLTTGAATFATARSTATTLAENWLSRVNTLWPDLSGKVVSGTRIYGPPSNVPAPSILGPQTLREEPHVAALILRACLSMLRAGVGTASRHTLMIERAWGYLEMMWQESGDMAGTWCPYPTTGEWTSQGHGDILLTLAEMLNYVSFLPAGIAPATVRARLVATRFWLEGYGTTSAKTMPDAGIINTYSNFPVFDREIEWTDSFDYGANQLVDVYDNDVARPVRRDTANRTFLKRTGKFVLQGIEDHRKFYTLLQALRGRAVAVWVPSWTDDFMLVSAVTYNASVMIVANAGYALSGGVRPERQFIMIELVDGTRLFRRIMNYTATGAGNESLELESIFGRDFGPADVVRICFINLMHLDHDDVTLAHVTDTEGVSEVSLSFLSAPRLRTATNAIF